MSLDRCLGGCSVCTGKCKGYETSNYMNSNYNLQTNYGGINNGYSA